MADSAGQPAPNWMRRSVVWLAAGSVAVSSVALSQLSLLLGQVENGGDRAYTANAFSGWRLPDSRDLHDAFALWSAQATGAGTPGPGSWVMAHLIIDSVGFAPALYFLLCVLLRRIGLGPAPEGVTDYLRSVPPWVLPSAALAADLLENALVWFLWMSDPSDPGTVLTGIAACVSIAKWVLVGLTLIMILLRWIGVRQAQGDIHPLWQLRWPGTICAGFALLVAAPFGGPLDQVPDVIRAQLETPAMAGAIASLLVFAGAVVHAGRRSTPAPGPTKPQGVRGTLIRIGLLALGALLLTPLVQLVLSGTSPGDSWWIPSASVLVAGAVVGIVMMASQSPGADPSADNEGSRLPDWIAGLSAVVILVGVVGAWRALGTILALDRPTYVTVLAALAAGLLAGVVGLATHWLARRLILIPRSRFLFGLCAVTAAVSAIALAIWPERGVWLGSNGVVAVMFAAYVSLFGELTRLSVRGPNWTWLNGRASRMPYPALLLVTGLVAGALNSSPTYHVARVYEPQIAPNATPPTATASPTGYLHPNLHLALDRWRTVTANRSECMRNGRTPLTLVAAPGGGIRAAYWTAEGLDDLSSGPCGSDAIFAISSVSGGSVGATAWAASGGHHGSRVVRDLAADSALAGSTASLLTRDPAAALLGVDYRAWRDRSAVMEDLWVSAAPGALARDGAARRWSDLALRPGGWTPAMVLNGTSVTDGCRVLVANTGGLSASGPNCQASPRTQRPGGSPSGQPSGPVIGSVDAFAGLVSPTTEDAVCPPAGPQGQLPTRDMSAVTAALLSARFPIVSSTGLLIRCLPGGAASGAGPSTGTLGAIPTYDVDGGYAENSALQTLLEIERALAPMIAGQPIDVQIVILDNHYRSVAAPAGQDRPRELTAPLETLGNGGVSSGALEQQAVYTSTGPGGSSAVTVIAPQVNPGVAAPLGWVLSSETQTNLDEQSDAAWGCPDSLVPGRAAPDSLRRELGLIDGGPGQLGVCGTGD